MLKQNTTLITQLFISLQSRPEADMIDFFKYENQREPPSLSDYGLLGANQQPAFMQQDSLYFCF